MAKIINKVIPLENYMDKFTVGDLVKTENYYYIIIDVFLKSLEVRVVNLETGKELDVPIKYLTKFEGEITLSN